MEPALWQAIALVAITLVLWQVFQGRGPVWRYGLLALLVMSIGFGAATLRTHWVQAPILAKETGAVTVTGRVSARDPLPKGQRIVIDKPRISRHEAFETPEAVRLTLRGNQPVLQPGDWVRVRAILSPPQPPAAPGAFDFQRYAFFQGIGGVGFSIGTADIIKKRASGGGLAAISDQISRLRLWVGDRVRSILDGEKGTIAAALMTGEKRAIAEPALQAMRDAGLAHLLAISGLHVGLMAGVVFVFLRGSLALIPVIALRYPIKKIAAFAALMVAIFYCLMAGATVPTVRAVLMAGVVLVAVMLDRRALTLRMVALAATIILLYQPEALLSASFQMSFAAVTALVAVYEQMRDARFQNPTTAQSIWRKWWTKPLVYMAGVALTTLVASAATGLFAAYHFNRFADYGLLANLLAVPVTALWVMPWAVLSFAAMPFGLDAIPLMVMGQGVSLVLTVANWVASMPGSVAMMKAFPDQTMILVVAGGLMLCLVPGKKRIAGLGVMLLGFALVPGHQGPDILVGSKGAMAAVQLGDELVFANPKGRRFVKGVWLRRAGQEKALSYDKAAELSPDYAALGPNPHKPSKRPVQLSCDGRSCLYRAGGKSIALVREPGALLEDCWQADVVIAAIPVRPGVCPPETRVLDRFDFWRGGVHALWITDQGDITIKSVNAMRGNRPWVAKRVPKGP